MSRWIVDGCAQFDASAGLGALAVHLPLRDVNAQIPSTQQPNTAQRISAISGAAEVVQVLRAPENVVAMLLDDLERLGAVCVSELACADWTSLRVWPHLRPLQQRRVLQIQQLTQPF